MSKENAVLVKLLLEQGAVIYVHTNMQALYLQLAYRNPDPLRCTALKV